MLLDTDQCYHAATSKDARFDGWFVVGVLTTGIYCRPSCPARTPKRENVRFFASTASAQRAGLRACLRCRPDATPGSPEWNVRADVVARAMRLIRDGVVDRDGVEGLASRLGYSARQLHRLISAEVGTGPLALARAQRSQIARTLLETTDLAVTQVAFASGFSSVRQCNETIRQVFAESPSALRRRATAPGRADHGDWRERGIRLRLAGRRPFSAASVLGFLGARAVAGLEAVDGPVYSRSLRLAHGPGVVHLEADEDCDGGPVYVSAELHLADLRDLTTAVARCRQLLDLDADPVAILAVLGADPLIRPLVASEPGRRVPGAVDGFELAVRAIVGQQISVAGARSVIGRLVREAGDALAQPRGAVTHLFPTPSALVALARDDPGAFAMPASRRRAIVALGEAVINGDVVIDPGADPGALRQSLVALAGVGPWTADYVAMRALRDPDAFLPTDLGIRRALETLGAPTDQPGWPTLAERWRPWRSYAVVHLWSVAPASPLTNTKEPT